MTPPEQSPSEPLAITGAGMLTSLGQLAQGCAAARAGLNRFVEWEAYHALGVDEDFDEGQPIRIAPAPLEWEDSHHWDRLVDLALPAMEEALLNAGLSRAAAADGAMCVGLPIESDRPEDVDLAEYFLRGVYEEGRMPELPRNRVYAQGHAAGVMALGEASGFLTSGEASYCLVGGVDSFLDIERLNRLDQAFRLRSQRAIDGYIPGEGAAFIVVESLKTAHERGAKPWALVHAVGVADEPNPLGAEEPSAAAGLCEAIRAAGSGDVSPSGWVLSDFNGERTRAREWGLASTRLHKVIGEDVELWHPAENFGDLGPASLPLLIALAARAFQRGEAPRETALATVSSDGPMRGAVLLGPGGQAV